jgi:hypothetical protein
MEKKGVVYATGDIGCFLRRGLGFGWLWTKLTDRYLFPIKNVLGR